MTPEETKIVRRALGDVISGVVKKADAPMSASTHLNQAIVCLGSLVGFDVYDRPHDAYCREVIAEAQEEMRLLRQTMTA